MILKNGGILVRARNELVEQPSKKVQAMNGKCGYITNSIILLFAATALNAAVVTERENYSDADIPDAMTFLNGKQVKSADDWKARKVGRIPADSIHGRLMGQFQEKVRPGAGGPAPVPP